jgi:hypothetical protein
MYANKNEEKERERERERERIKRAPNKNLYSKFPAKVYEDKV